MAHLTVVATIKAKPGQEEALLSALQGLVGPTRAEQGCIVYDLHRSADEPGTFLFHETWESRPLWEAHMRSAHIAALGEALGALAQDRALFAGHRLDGAA